MAKAVASALRGAGPDASSLCPPAACDLGAGPGGFPRDAMDGVTGARDPRATRITSNPRSAYLVALPVFVTLGPIVSSWGRSQDTRTGAPCDPSVRGNANVSPLVRRPVMDLLDPRRDLDGRTRVVSVAVPVPVLRRIWMRSGPVRMEADQ